MDAISYSYADKQAKRITKFNANPDSDSGIVTVPKVIEAGESVTVPAGRVAVLPNVQVDGTLNIEGEVFIPAGSSVDFSTGIKVNGEKLTMSIPTAYHIYNGSVEATNTILTNGFSTTLYTGNGTTQSINTGVDMATQWGDDASETFGGLVWLKSRSAATNNFLFDTVRGVLNEINSNTTEAQASLANSLTAFNDTGFSLGSAADINVSAATYASWNFQTTHRRTGVTNHGKSYTEHYNPFTGFTIIKYEGSGLAGHEIPHHLGRKLGFVTTKNLSAVGDWTTYYGEDSKAIFLNLTNATVTPTGTWDSTEVKIVAIFNANVSANQYILYGWANSYFDESGKLIGNYEIGVYQGTGATGNKVTTRGKPAWIMVKRLDVSTDWLMVDNKRSNFDGILFPNLTNIEVNVNNIDIVNDGFVNQSAGTGNNASGGQYLYMVVYDNDSGSGKSKYPKATDTTNLTINALVPYANGIDVNGSKISIEYKNETITGLTLTQGKNYPYSKNDSTYGVNKYEPMYSSLRDRSVVGENPDYFDLKTMKWYSTTGGEELVTNGTFDVGTNGWTTYNSSTISVSSGTLKLQGTTTDYPGCYQEIPVVTGRKYKINFNTIVGSYSEPYVSVTNSFYGRPITGSDSSIYNAKNGDTFIASTSSVFVHLWIPTTADTQNVYFNNISVFEAEPTIGAEITPRTYLDCVVYADHNGQVEYVEELPKIEYKDVIKANEFKGKNACTAWVNFDGTTTPPTIRDSYNVKSVIRTATGLFDVYFKEPMDNLNYCISMSTGGSNASIVAGASIPSSTLKQQVFTYSSSSASYTNSLSINVQFFGGKE